MVQQDANNLPVLLEGCSVQSRPTGAYNHDNLLNLILEEAIPSYHKWIQPSLRAPTLAPLSSRKLTIASFPQSAAAQSGVVPSLRQNTMNRVTIDDPVHCSRLCNWWSTFARSIDVNAVIQQKLNLCKRKQSRSERKCVPPQAKQERVARYHGT